MNFFSSDKYQQVSFRNKKWRRSQHFTILKWILVLDTRKLQIQTKKNSNRIIDHQQQSNTFLRLKSTLATVSNQRTAVRLCYFCKGELKMTQQTHKNIYSSFVQRRQNNSKEKGFQTDIYWSQATKFRNRTRKNDPQKPQMHRASLISAPVTQRIWNAAQVVHSGSALKFRISEQYLRSARNETLFGFRVTVCSSVLGFWPSKKQSVMQQSGVDLRRI